MVAGWAQVDSRCSGEGAAAGCGPCAGSAWRPQRLVQGGRGASRHLKAVFHGQSYLYCSPLVFKPCSICLKILQQDCDKIVT